MNANIDININIRLRKRQRSERRAAHTERSAAQRRKINHTTPRHTTPHHTTRNNTAHTQKDGVVQALARIQHQQKLSPKEYHACPTFTRLWYSDHSRNIAGRFAAPLAATKHETPAPTAATHHRLAAVGATNQKTVGTFYLG